MKDNKSNLKFVFVHGLSGWGSYDLVDKFFPYWGLSSGNIIKYLNKQGYKCYSASVSPTYSAWDRACELYGQLTGSVVDYGKEHSERCNHLRYGKDFRNKPLIDDFENSKIVLIGHSFGGATIRVFSEILANGVQKEKEATDPDSLSPFFKGGKKDLIFAMITLAAPTNGTTAYDMYNDPSFDISGIKIPEKYEKMGGMVSKGSKPKDDGRVKYDYASFDMHIDNAYKLNNWISTLDNVYYFAYPCCSAKDNSNEPDEAITEDMFMRSAIIMSKYKGKTQGGITIDESWQRNDGLVNEVSAKAPSNAPMVDYDEDTIIQKGVWHIMPTQKGDHMYFQGGMTKRVNIRPFYLSLVKKISELE